MLLHVALNDVDTSGCGFLMLLIQVAVDTTGFSHLLPQVALWC